LCVYRIVHISAPREQLVLSADEIKYCPH